MRKYLLVVLTLTFVLAVCSMAYATNGDNMISAGSASNAMGGVGIVAPQDAVTATFANPAALACSGTCKESVYEIKASLFMPSPKTEISIGNNTYSASSKKVVYPIPAIGYSTALTDKVMVGVGAYGVSGMGVDYRNTSIDNDRYYDFSAMYGKPPGSVVYPLSGAAYSQLSLMQFAPAVSYTPNDKFSVGLAAKVNIGSLDFGTSSTTAFGVGGQVGFLYHATDLVSLGLVYTSPISSNYDQLRDFDGDGELDDLRLEAPQQIGFGIAIEPIKNSLLFETNLKWINWANAKGYKEFDWQDQWVLALGAQYKPTPEMALRLGYNYGKNPAKEHNNFVGSSMTSLQGKTMPTYYYENFRIVGFPGIVEHHLTMGVGYKFSKNLTLELGYMHAFSKTIQEKGTDMLGQPVTLKSTLSENSIELGLVWRI
ncbi:MAG: outer membrane protein transport protein [Nitrospirae bacterium]|nr:outer membrane protein transport protein [Nitrospirota bacterium]